VTDASSEQVQEVETLGVTGEHVLVPVSKVSGKKLQTCCSVEVVTFVTAGLFQFALAYSVPARAAPLSEAAVFIKAP
jgi:hypothetical protein